MRLIWMVLVLWMALPAMATETTKIGERHTLMVGELARHYYLYMPPKAASGPRPLVVVLHGGGGKPAGAARMTGFSDLADHENFLVAYPEGTGRVPTWNAGKCCGYAQRMDIDDVAFIRAMVDDIRSKIAVDDARIYATGMSNGGMMAYRLACEMGEVFSVVAPVAGAMNTFTCMPKGRPSLIVFHALDDKHVLFAGGPSEKGLRAMLGKRPKPDTSVEEAMRFWLGHNYCRNIPQVDRYENYSVTHFFCAEGRDMQLYTLNGGGHSWPGGEEGYEGGDEPLAEPSATRAMWEFFMQHPPRPLF